MSGVRHFVSFVFALAAACAVRAEPERTPEAESLLNSLRRLPSERRYLVAWTHPWREDDTACAVQDAAGAWRAKALEDIRLDGYVKRRTGKDPLLYFTDFYLCLGTWENQAQYARTMANMEGFVRKAYDAWHSVPVFSWHIENPYAPHRRLLPPQSRGCAYRYRHGCDGYPPEHRYVLREILTGTGARCGQGRARAADEADVSSFENPKAWYDAQLDKVCAFLLRLKDRSGRPIPVVVRPFHECEDDWMWWGPASASVADYKALFRHTVTEIRRRTGLRSLLFLYSPDRFWGRLEGFLKRYPGDDVVDIVGFDDYSIGKLPKDWKGEQEDGVRKSLEKTVERMRIVSAFARERGKPAGLVETGVGGRDEAFYGLVREAMNAPGVSFSFFNTWGGNLTVPQSDAGQDRWREFLELPEALTAGKGYDLIGK